MNNSNYSSLISYISLSKNVQLYSSLPTLLIDLIVLTVCFLQRSSISFPCQMVGLVCLADLLDVGQILFILIDYTHWPYHHNLCIGQAVFNSLGHIARNCLVFLVTLIVYLTAARQIEQNSLIKVIRYYIVFTILFSLFCALLPLATDSYGFNVIQLSCTIKKTNSTNYYIIHAFTLYFPNAVFSTANLVLLCLIARCLKNSPLDFPTKKYIYLLLSFPLFQEVLYVLFFTVYLLIGVENQLNSQLVIMQMVLYSLDNL